MKKATWLPILVGVALLMGGCPEVGDSLVQNNNPKVRMANAVNGPAVDAFVTNNSDVTMLLDNQPFGSVSTLAVVDNGNRTLSFRDAATGDVIAQRNVLLEVNKTYTVVGYGPMGADNMVIVNDTLEARPGQAALRIVHAADPPALVDIYRGPVGGGIGTATLLRDDLATGTSTLLTYQAVGPATIYVTGANNQDVLVSRDHTFDEFDVVTLLVANDGQPRLLIIGG